MLPPAHVVEEPVWTFTRVVVQSTAFVGVRDVRVRIVRIRFDVKTMGLFYILYVS